MPDHKRRRTQPRLLAGLISGTSADGIDAAVVRISGPNERPRIELLTFICAPYPAAVRKRVLHMASGAAVPAGEISELNFLLGELFANAALVACKKAGIKPQELRAIGSHGQTIFHHGGDCRGAVLTAKNGERNMRSTFQIGEPAVIAERTGAPVVADFRSADLAAGGQGAPLVPMLDYLALRNKHEGTIALNIGGIANVTVIPASAAPDDVMGFDTGPGNMIMDSLVQRFSHGRRRYDSGGRMAALGKVLEDVLDKALQFSFFRQTPPKSAGREEFGYKFVDATFCRGGSRTAPAPNGNDLLRTACELTARTIAGALEEFVFPRIEVSRLIVSGGGARNSFLVQRLRELLPGLQFCLSDEFGLPIDAKEAIAFALLADRTLNGLPGNLRSVTGARRAVVLGSVHHSRSFL